MQSRPTSSFPRVRKAVFPVAGLGTRFLPATKVSPKEMLPIVDKPIIQYGVEEAIAAGIEEIIFVSSRSKRAIEDHFDSATELETLLALQGKHALLDELRRQFPENISYVTVRQAAPRGLGHAVLCARHLVGDEPFAVILPDDVMDAETPVLAQMIECYQRHGASVLAVEQVPRSQTGKYGIVAPVREDADGAPRVVNGGADSMLAPIGGIVEKPAPEAAPSTLAVVGRYVLTPAIFDCIESCPPGVGAEIQLTDGIARLLAQEAVLAYRFRGARYDCGSKLGFLAATLNFGLKHPELAEPFARLVAASAHGAPTTYERAAPRVHKPAGLKVAHSQGEVPPAARSSPRASLTKQ